MLEDGKSFYEAKPEALKCRVETQENAGDRRRDFGTHNPPPGFPEIADDVIDAIRAHWNPMQGFGNKIVISLTLKVGLQPFLLGYNALCGIADMALGMIQVPQPDNERGVIEPDRAQPYPKTFLRN